MYRQLHLDTNKELSSCVEELASAFGVNWNHHALFFKFTARNQSTIITKRTILFPFDPLRLLSPLIVVAKILLQELWFANLCWDDSVPQNIHTAWTEFFESFQTVSLLSIPRY